MAGESPEDGGSQLPYLLVEGKLVASEDISVQLYFDDLDAGDIAFPLLLIAEFEGKSLVAVPFEAWHRQVTRRRMQPGALSEPAVIEVLAADGVDKTILEPEQYIKCWAGFLKPDLLTHLQPLVDYEDCTFTFGSYGEAHLLPAAESLVAAANEHFAFFSAGDGASSGGEVELLEAGRDADASGSGGLETRVETIEATLKQIGENMNTLLKKFPDSEQTTAPRVSALRKPTKQLAEKPKQPKVHFPHLDAGVVDAALQAGIPPHSLAMMEKLVTQNVRAKKVLEERSDVVLADPLSEEEDDSAGRRPVGGEESGGAPLDPMAATLSKLTTIVSFLAEDKKKVKTASRLDLALDSAQGSSASEAISLGSGKKTAAARRALRTTLSEHPEEIHMCIEKLMYEDLASQTLGPGQPPWGLNARAWVEHRSRINGYKTGAHCAWAFAGILDALVAGKVDLARARACLGLVQLDQAAIDKGSWVLAAELSLEQTPPMSVLSTHQGPNIQDGESPFSRLLDARWAEVTLGHLRDQEEFLTRRKNIGKNIGKSAKEESEESVSWEAKRRAKAKAKSKAGAAAEKNQDA